MYGDQVVYTTTTPTVIQGNTTTPYSQDIHNREVKFLAKEAKVEAKRGAKEEKIAMKNENRASTL